MPLQPLGSDALRWSLPAHLLTFEHTGQTAPVSVLPGQADGRQALAAAARARRGGHLLVTGLRDPQRRTILATALQELDLCRRSARDLVYVARPGAPDRPQLLELQPGRAVAFRRALRELRDELRVAWPDDLEGGAEAYAQAQSAAFQPLIDAFPGAAGWLADLQRAVAERTELFRPGVDPARRAADGDTEARELLAAFQAHLFHAAGRVDQAPVVVVGVPSMATLAGGLARGRRDDPGHLALRSGQVHDAHGGFLVVDADDLSRSPGSLRLLRALMSIDALPPVTGPGQAGAVRPDAVPLDVRLVVVASSASAVTLWGGDPDLSAAMLQPVQLDPRPEVDGQVVTELAGWLRHRGEQTGRRPLAAQAVGLVIEHLVRRGGRGGRVPLDLRTLDALADDADAVATGELVMAAHMSVALGAWRQRRAQAADWARRAVLEDFVLVATEGQVVGQLNGLAVYRSSGFPHARPIRITATAGAGRGGLVDVERDVGLAGNSHNKGVRLLTGFMRARFSRRRTLAIHATLGIEQHYGRIDGDSASVAELCALISAISRVPLRQDRAVTGSVDQLGQVQSVGSVTLKVEGFFRVCEGRGLTGQQGVVVPARNVGDLCLADDVVDACSQGRFHVWAAETVEDVLAILTDVEVGAADAVEWSDDTIYGKVLAELVQLEAVVRRAAKGPGSK